MSDQNRTPQAESRKSQPDKFRDLARELWCNEDEAAFEETVRRVAKAPPATEVEKPE